MKYLFILLASTLVIPNAVATTTDNSGSISHVVNNPIDVPKRSANPRKELRKLAREKGWKLRWDNDKNRIMVIGAAGITMDKYDPDFLAKRQSLVTESILTAKAQIIESFVTTASASNVLTTPGNPIAKQLEAEQRQLRQIEKDALDNLTRAQAEVTDLMAAVDKQSADELKGITVGDRFGALLDASIKRLDESFDSSQISDEKKRRLDELKLRLEKAERLKKEKKTLLQEVETKIAELQGSIKQEQKSTMETLSEMPLFGATVLTQIESYNDLTGAYELASLVAWSPRLEAEAQTILLRGQIEASPRSRTIDEWLDIQDLSVMVGPRRYISSDGVANFMGIAAIEYDYNDPGSYSMKEAEVELWAKQLALLSLTADVTSYQKAEQLRQDTIGADGKTQSRVLSDFTRELSESVENITISGLEILRIEETVHPSSGKDIIVAVASINSKLASQANQLMSDTYAVLKEINADQSFQAGFRAGLVEEANSTKNDPNAFNQGFAQGRNSVNSASSQSNKKIAPEDIQKKEEKSGLWKGDKDIDDGF